MALFHVTDEDDRTCGHFTARGADHAVQMATTTHEALLRAGLTEPDRRPVEAQPAAATSEVRSA